jgi:hypothetical protein
MGWGQSCAKPGCTTRGSWRRVTLRDVDGDPVEALVWVCDEHWGGVREAIPELRRDLS